VRLNCGKGHVANAWYIGYVDYWPAL